MRRLEKKSISLLLVCLIIILQVVCFISCGNKDQIDNGNTSTEPSGNENNDSTPSVDNNEQINNNGNETIKEKFIVRFIADNGIPISIKECTEGETLTPPTPPKRIGYVFVGWNGDYTNITQNTDIVANYTDISKIANAISADTVYISGDSKFEVLVAIYGNVSFCGLDMDITYDINLLDYIDSTNVDDCVIFNNEVPGIIHMNYVSTNNTTGEVDFMTLRFKSKTSAKNETDLQINIHSMYSIEDNDIFEQSEYQVLQNKIIIEETHDEK